MGALKLPQLTAQEAADLVALERVIEKGRKSFLAVGRALLEIQTRQLHKSQHLSFESYVEARWGISRTHGYRLIHAAEVQANLSPMGGALTSERQARDITGTPEEQRALWEAKQALERVSADRESEERAERVRKAEARALDRRDNPPRQKADGDYVAVIRGCAIKAAKFARKIEEPRHAVAAIEEVAAILRELHRTSPVLETDGGAALEVYLATARRAVE